jgi:hypothetical protein
MVGTIREEHGALAGIGAHVRFKSTRRGHSRMPLHPLLITPMLDTMPQRTTTTVRVYPETRAEIARLAEAEGVTAAELLESIIDRASGKAMLAEANTYWAAHPGEGGRDAERFARTLADGLDDEVTA